MVPEIRTVGVVGAGTMGAGIAQVALEAGHEVQLYDPLAEALSRARARIGDGLTRRAAKMDQGAGWVAGCLDRLVVTATLNELGAGSDIVIEAAIEELEAKRAIFRTLASAAPPDAILATNTSALSVAAIGEATSCPERVIGLHFFNPAPVMALVEIVGAPRTDPAVTALATDLMKAWGKTPVRCADSPGFIVNRVNRPFTLEALRMLEAGEAGCITIDAAIRAAGFPMGPFELMDLVGIDINLAAGRAVWEGLGRPDRLRPSPIQERLVATGRLGRKTGEGFYRYDETGRARGPAEISDEGSAGRPAGVTPDETAIVGRIRNAIDAEARLAEAAGVATAADIDLALRLGAGHPPRTSPLR